MNIFSEINRIFDKATPKLPRFRLMPEGECTYCDKYRLEPMMPSHHASSRCESGMRNHCTCDICF